MIVGTPMEYDIYMNSLSPVPNKTQFFSDWNKSIRTGGEVFRVVSLYFFGMYVKREQDIPLVLKSRETASFLLLNLENTKMNYENRGKHKREWTI